MKRRGAALPKHFSLPGLSVTNTFWLFLAPLYADASLDYFDLAPEQLLSAQVLSVSKKNEPVAEAPAAIYVVTSEDIERSGITTIPDALRMVPGVMVARADSNSWAISIRGFNSALANKLLVLVDGRTIYNPLFGGVFWEAHNLMLEDIQRIEVVRGPGGTLWGANAVNGVINIITKHTRATQGNFASALYGNEEQGTLSLRHGGSFEGDNFYRVYAKGFKRDASYKPGAGDTYDEWDGFRTGFRADWNEQFTLQGDAHRNNTQQRRTHFSLSPPFSTLEDQTITYQGVNLLGRWTDKRRDGSQLSVQSYIDWAERDEPFNFIDKRSIYDLEVQYNLAPRASHEIIAGAGYRFLSDHEQGDNNVSFSPQGRRNSIYSVFAQDKITLSPEKWFLTLGSKFEHNEFSGFEIQPNIRLQWLPDQDQTLWSAVSRAVRTPTPLEEDLTSTLATAPNVRAAFVPNNDFHSETLTAYELGYRRQLTPELSTDLTTFYNDYQHLATIDILPAYLVDGDEQPPHFFLPVMFTNNMKGNSQGVEMSFNWNPHQHLKITANYSFLSMSLEALNPTQESGEDIHPTHQAGATIYWNINRHWTLDTSVNYVDKLPAFDIENYIRLDMNIGRKISDNLRFNLVGQNLLDGSHREFGSPDDINVGEIERSVFGKLTWAF